MIIESNVNQIYDNNQGLISLQKIESHEQFQEWIHKENVIALFTADWCPDCQVIEPVLPDIENTFSNYTFIEVDRDRFIDICQEYEIFGIPSFIAFHNGEETGRFVSKDRKTKAEIVEFIERLPNGLQS